MQQFMPLDETTDAAREPKRGSDANCSSTEVDQTVDENLLPQIAAGHEPAVAECIERYGDLIWAIAQRLLASRADAEDVVQEIFIEIWRHAARFDPALASEKTFIVMIARRRIIDRQRKLGRTAAEQPIDEAELQRPGEERPASIETDDEVARAIGCLQNLREEHRRVLELAIYHGLSQARISTHEGMPLGTVKSNARRGLSQLRDCMGVIGGEVR